MKLDIRGLNFDLTNSIMEHVRLRLGAAVACMAPHILAVRVRVNDVNGPRGGPDMRCHFEVTLDRLGTVVVEQTETDLYAAIDRAATRLRQALQRRLKRFQSDRSSRAKRHALPTGAPPSPLRGRSSVASRTAS